MLFYLCFPLAHPFLFFQLFLLTHIFSDRKQGSYSTQSSLIRLCTHTGCITSYLHTGYRKYSVYIKLLAYFIRASRSNNRIVLTAASCRTGGIEQGHKRKWEKLVMVKELKRHAVLKILWISSWIYGAGFVICFSIQSSYFPPVFSAVSFRLLLTLRRRGREIKQQSNFMNFKLGIKL